VLGVRENVIPPYHFRITEGAEEGVADLLSPSCAGGDHMWDGVSHRGCGSIRSPRKKKTR